MPALSTRQRIQPQPVFPQKVTTGEICWRKFLETQLRIRNLYKTFSGFVALDRVNLDVGENEFVCLLGPSGCGKTTLLRIIAGLLDFDGGQMELGGTDLAKIPARDRGFGLVFQSYSLFPNMTVAQNIGYGLRVQKADKEFTRNKVNTLLDLIKLSDMASRYPHQLSGGQQQRVAIARALAVDPSLLLLDEPLSALDARVRAEMRSEIREVQQRLGIPTIMVTHDQEEALTMADKIVCMKNGMIEQTGTPLELYQQPRTRFVADFVGVSNIVPASWVKKVMPENLDRRPAGRDDAFDFAFRPEQVTVSPAQGETEAARIKELVFLGSLSRITVHWHGEDINVELQGYPNLHVGDNVHIQLTKDAGTWVSA